jgi:hypothetical protein
LGHLRNQDKGEIVTSIEPDRTSHPTDARKEE